MSMREEAGVWPPSRGRSLLVAVPSGIWRRRVLREGTHASTPPVS